jgi:hypothetical protein
MRRIAVVLSSRLLVNFAKACVVNPSMDGHILEAWFFAELSHKGLDWSYWAESTLKHERWEQTDIVFFDPDKYKVSVSLDDSTCMASVKWNQGGYDAVFVNKSENLVRFVQLMRVEKNTFDHTYFVALLNNLAADPLSQIAVVELCLVIPMAKLEGFVLPESEDDFQRNVVQVASSEPRSRVDQTFQNCNGKVMVIGVDNEIATQ